MKAEIITSGTELLLGEATDAHTPFLAAQLAMLGIDLYYSSIVGDNYDRFLGVLKQAHERSDIVIITGGLGPTRGDITREVIAILVGETMEIDPALQQYISGYFVRLGMEMPENNLKQAMLIPSARAILNPLGTAPGWWVEKDGKIIISLPGPPAEMQSMWEKEIFPRLERRGGAIILSRTLKTWGLSEARIDQMVGHFMSQPNPTLALYAKADGIQLRITAKASSKESAEELIREREKELRQILKGSVWGVDNEILEAVTGQLILGKGLTLAVAESLTGGLLSYSLASVPENQRFIKGGIIAIDEEARALLGIAPGTLSEKDGIQTALRMSAIARDKFSADIGIAIDGYVESDDINGTGKAYIAITQRQNGLNFSQAYSWRPHQLVRRSVMHAIFNLRQFLLEIT